MRRSAPPAGSGRHGPPPDPVIEVTGLDAGYGERKILHGVALRVRRGETAVVMGPSGCGKSTLLKCLVGLLKPMAGTVSVLGTDLATASEAELQSVHRRVGVAFQGAALLNSLTTAENVSLPLREHTRLDAATVRIMTRMKLEQVGLGGYEDYMPSELSGGMRKRAGIARALIMDPPCLMLDEPSSGLDPITAAGVDNLLLRLRAAMGLTLVVITHEMASAAILAEKTLMLDDGRVRFWGTLDELRASQDERVRQFLDRRPDPETHATDRFLEELDS